MEPREKKEFFNGEAKIEINSKFPAGQGYSPVIVQETHYNISLNGHRINISESAFNELLNIFFRKDNEVKEIKNETLEEEIHEQVEVEGLKSLQNRYADKFNRAVPPRYRNNAEWIEKALEE